ncbi:MAG: glycine--tRNA ligase subunit beta [Candidatus Latescibacteria bacterium]|nr:glycine--tRNA ligase subunit beta [Candidatus Latescibacterota bacterium]NIM21613.1 glycine--tRNA ligase subunit beta [Candidatus Latescibacterota bacterium]NIM64592.1 glycine--tRNA ligase subunit beta [Candidatus Latescibacterota bacterium]NIO01107.1 glycine--tRNA ligase subunit beta [Candidatus Latescibacterota bacterium]NIO27500.1 glycine--tRNA ligase subunit beta [Candidatus Latescibacterota bacterium]
MRDFLLEIGCEDIPASYVPPAVSQLKGEAAKRLKELRVDYGDIYATGTPRRLVLIIKGLAAAQKSEVDVITGPPVSKSFSEDGTPTKAAIGFAKSHGLRVDDLEKIQTERGQYLGFKKRQRSQRTQSLLKREIPGVLASLKFPKTMRWEEGGTKFARPIRWIVCLYGDSPVRFDFAGVKSGSVSFYVPWISPAKIRIRSSERYLETMTKKGIIVDQNERETRIKQLCGRAAKRLGLTIIEDPGLFKELTFMLENPHAFVGDFPEKYLSLPPEVVITAMKTHQRYLALRGKRKALVPKFVAFTEGKPQNPLGVKKGNERVLGARLEDAYFYWQEDLKRGIDGLSSMLESIVFIEKLGTLKDKAARLESLMLFLNGTSGVARPVPERGIKRVAILAKADLASEMVKDGKEFTLLEGLIGSHYASASGEDDQIVSAIREQYNPRSPADALPESPLGTYLTIADRIDTVCGCFLSGLVPTGSGDPYGLRRLSNGLLRVIEQNPLVPLDELIDRAVSSYVAQGLTDGQSAQETTALLREFFTTRCDAFLSEKGFPYDIVRAVTRVAWPFPGKAVERCHGIEKLRGNEAFERLIIGVKRVGNILGADDKIYGVDWETLEKAFFSFEPLYGDIRFDTGLFEESMERLLYDAVSEKISKIAASDRKGDFDGVLKLLSELGPPIDAYFDAVLVNCENPAIRINRIHFLACTFAIFSRFADFSCIVEEGASTTQ